MIIFIFTYKSGDSISFESKQFQTIDDAETFYFGHTSESEIVFQTGEGGVSVLCKDVVEFILKEVGDDGVPIHYREYDFKFDGHIFVTKFNGKATKQYQVCEWTGTGLAESSHTYEMDEEGKVEIIESKEFLEKDSPLDIGGEDITSTQSVDSGLEDITNTQSVDSGLDVTNTQSVDSGLVDTVNTILAGALKASKEKETVDMDENETTGENKIGQKFVGFREKYIDSESKQDAWENQIIEKMIRREEKLKSMADVLDKENEFLEQFKQDKLGV